MKFYPLLSLLVLLNLSAISLQAQVCEPDPKYTEEGVWPPPDTTMPRFTNPNRGINKMACKDEPYSFTFTINVPDSANGDKYGEPGRYDLEWVRIDSINNMPPGVSYLCEPEDCLFPDKQSGCVTFTGTPTDTGDFSIVLWATVRVKDFGGFNINEVTFPQNPDKPEFGEYIVRVLTPEECAALNSQTDISEQVSLYPNPSENGPLLQLNNSESGLGKIEVFKTLGQQVEFKRLTLERGSQEIQIGKGLGQGMYFYRLTTPSGTARGEFLIN